MTLALYFFILLLVTRKCLFFVQYFILHKPPFSQPYSTLLQIISYRTPHHRGSGGISYFFVV